MANVAHSSLTAANLHEPKGAAAAAVNKVYVSDGAGSGVWQQITHSQLTTTGNPFGGQLMHVRDEKASGTNGGTFSAGTWQTRTLNTGKTLEISGSGLASNQITLPAGTYYIDATAPAHQVTNHTIRFRNITDGTNTIIGTAERTGTTSVTTTRSFLKGRFTIAAQKVFELQHICNSTESTVGLGDPTSQGVVEVYAEVCIWKVA